MDPMPVGTFREICKRSAEAVSRYVALSGEDPGDDMPESFVSSFVFDKLELTATLETNIDKLFRWNADKRMPETKNSQLDDTIAKSTLPFVLKDLNCRPRVDLVLFQGEEKAKSDHRLLALVEFKRHGIYESDKDKLLAILRHIGTCPFGVICSVIQSTPDSTYVVEQEKHAIAVGDFWHIEEVRDLPAPSRDFTICLRAFRPR